jgi:hypothetical protein
VAATSVNNRRVYDALTQMRDLLQEYGTPEQRERLDRIKGGAIPAPRNFPVETQTYLAEGLLIAFEMIGELKEASKPRPRGRPPKQRKDDKSKDDKAA